MKTLHLSIIALAGITFIGIISFLLILQHPLQTNSYTQTMAKCHDMLPVSNQNLELRKYTWISVMRIQPQQIKEICFNLDDKTIEKLPVIYKALSGADGCFDNTVDCTIPKGISTDSCFDFGVCVTDNEGFEISMSPQEKSSLANEVQLTIETQYPPHSFLKYNEKYYQLIVFSTDEYMPAETMLEFEKPIEYVPVPLMKGQSLNYTIFVKALSTFGKPAVVDLKAGHWAKDSNLDVKIEPEHLVVQEWDKQNTTLVITANKNTQDGIYQVFVTGQEDGGTYVGPYNPVNFPSVQVGDSEWTIYTYGQDQGIGMGGKLPSLDTWAKLELDKDSYKKGDTVQIKAYLVNNSTNRIALDQNPHLIISVIKGTDVGYYENLYGISSSIDSDKKLILEPQSKTLLARPFYWDQNTFGGFEETHRLEPRKYQMMMSFGSYNGTVWNDEKWFEIK